MVITENHGFVFCFKFYRDAMLIRKLFKQIYDITYLVYEIAHGWLEFHCALFDFIYFKNLINQAKDSWSISMYNIIIFFSRWITNAVFGFF